MRMFALCGALFLFFLTQAHADNTQCSNAVRSFVISQVRATGFNASYMSDPQGVALGNNFYDFRVTVGNDLSMFQTYAVHVRHDPYSRSCHLEDIWPVSMAY